LIFDISSRRKQGIHVIVAFLAMILLVALVPIDSARAAVETPVYRINAGGPDVGPWSGLEVSTKPKKLVEGVVITGNPYDNAPDHPPVTFNTSQVSVPEALFDHLIRADNEMRWAFTLDNGNYRVLLHFAEHEDSTETQMRSFDVGIEGTPVLTDFNILAAAGGHNKAITRSFETSVSDGKLNIDFLAHNLHGGTIRAIEVRLLDTAPVAVDDVASTTNAKQVVINVLGNDSDMEGDKLSLGALTAPQHGTVSKSGNKVRYAPDASFCGTDKFTYEVTAGGLTDHGSVTVNVFCAGGSPPGSPGGPGGPPIGPGGEIDWFVDDDGTTFEADINAIAGAGITKGCNPPIGDRYCPADNMTRGQFAAFIARYLQLTPPADNPFVDTNGHTFEQNIAAMADAGITKGCNPPANDRFCPDANMTRGQFAAFLVRYLHLTPPAGNPFVDTNGHTFEHDIAALAAAGITKGCNPPANDMFCPGDPVTRGQVAAFFNRTFLR